MDSHTAALTPQSRLGRVVDRHRLGSFFALAFAFSWTFWFGAALSDAGDSLGLAAVVPGAFGPPLAAAAVVRLGGGSVRRWARAVSPLRVSLRWYAVALLLPVAMVAVETVALSASGVELRFEVLPARVAAFLPTVLFMALLGGGQKEPGWRGFALPRLQRRLAPLPAALALGVVWAVWHLPLFHLPGSSQYGASFLTYGVGVVGLSVVFTWLYNRTASVAVVVALHGSYNAATTLYPVPLAELVGTDLAADVLVVVAAATWGVALLLVVATRGDLGHRGSRVATRRFDDADSSSEPRRGD
ncbi:CPBP family intramembrane glutamic endopeptidase [Haloprofundus salinisoli]|uniref:CPBP family intramembrane glutamic endopeptidase n=1 Tax=Haloprofundus salinisoli TaxID=2876193 RepID=UPI001CCA638E|nr:type II CAAX endopeptidase family protein [Haloprofundus salinisoli]